mgnify:CR=1 FL=1|jgi:hypothetical protein
MNIKDNSVTVEINCPKSKSKSAMRSLDNHWLAWNYEYLESEEWLVFYDVEEECLDMLEDYEKVLMNGRIGFRDLDHLRNAIHKEVV